MNASARIRKWMFGISPEETTFAKRGFQGEGPLRERFEEIGRTFVAGYHAALEENELQTLVPRLDSVPSEFRGFAYEGAAMGLALRDRFSLKSGMSNFKSFLQGPGEPHTYMLHVGLGWVFARVPMFHSTLRRVFSGLDPLLRWLTIDGYGFHEGFFRTPGKAREDARPPNGLGLARQKPALGGRASSRAFSDYAPRAFDQGLGRSLWFGQCADPDRISKMIVAFDLHRQPDLWSGVGLACGYAGNLQENGLRALLQVCENSRPQLAQGVAFAAKARQRAGNLMPFTEAACQIICGMSAQEAAQVTDAALENLPAVHDSDNTPAYEIWRCRIQRRLAQQKELKP